MGDQIPARGHRPGARPSRGFTLVELVVAMVIAAILAAIAIPAYSNYVRKSRRTEAKAALLDIASLEERYFSTNNKYSTNPQDLGYAPTATPFAVGNGYYSITTLRVLPAQPPLNSTSAGTPSTYTITATPNGDQMNDAACAAFTLTSAGAQTATGTDPNASTNCWR